MQRTEESEISVTDSTRTSIVTTPARSNKTLILGFDADGCIFNLKHFYLMLWLVNQYDYFFKKYSRDKLQINEKEFIQKKFSEIIQKIMKLDLSDKERNETWDNLIEEIQDRNRDPSPCSAEAERDYIVKKINACLKNIDQFGALADQLHLAVVLAANKDLFIRIEEKIKSDEFNKVVFESASNRSSRELDKFNSENNGTPLFSRVLRLVYEYFNKKYPHKCELDCYAVPNLNRKDTAGWQGVFDETKFSLYYFLAHRAWKNSPRDPVLIWIFDDKKPIIVSSVRAFLSHLNFFPNNIVMEFYIYKGELPKGVYIVKNKKGGDGDKHYLYNVLKMVAACRSQTATSVDVANCLNFEKFEKQLEKQVDSPPPSVSKNLYTLYQPGKPKTRNFNLRQRISRSRAGSELLESVEQSVNNALEERRWPFSQKLKDMQVMVEQWLFSAKSNAGEAQNSRISLELSPEEKEPKKQKRSPFGV